MSFDGPFSDVQFEKAVEIVRGLPKEGQIQPEQNDQLEFYSLYKQATVGPVNTERPQGLFDFAGKAKWDAWEKKKSLTPVEAKNQYVKKLLEILNKFKDMPEAVTYIEQILKVGEQG